VRKTHLGIRALPELVENDGRQTVLFQMKSVRVRRQVADLSDVPFDDHALLAVTDLPARHLDRRLVHFVGDSKGRHHLQRRRMVRARAQIDGEAGLGFQHEHRNTLLRKGKCGQQADRPGAGDDDLRSLRHCLGFSLVNSRSSRADAL
jgi:hypothetical protein